MTSGSPIRRARASWYFLPRPFSGANVLPVLLPTYFSKIQVVGVLHPSDLFWRLWHCTTRPLLPPFNILCNEVGRIAMLKVTHVFTAIVCIQFPTMGQLVRPQCKKKSRQHPNRALLRYWKAGILRFIIGEHEKNCAKKIPSKTVDHFPTLLMGYRQASVMKVMRLWRDRASFIGSDGTIRLQGTTVSFTPVTQQGIKCREVKAPRTGPQTCGLSGHFVSVLMVRVWKTPKPGREF